MKKITFRANCLMALAACCLLLGGILQAEEKEEKKYERPAGIKIGTFQAESRKTYTTAEGLPSNNVLSITVAADGQVFAGTDKGTAKFTGGKWQPAIDDSTPVKLIAKHGKNLICVADEELFLIEKGEPLQLASLPPSAVDSIDQHCLIGGERVLLGTSTGLLVLDGDTFKPDDELNKLMGKKQEIRQIAASVDGRVAIAAESGLFLSTPDGGWEAILPRDDKRSWAPYDVRGVAFDSENRLWFASPQGVGVQGEQGWTLYTGADGLPYNDFTTMAAGEQGVVWFGTRMGAIRFDGVNWEYRMAPQWLPDNLVRSIAVSDDGTAWFATEKGIGEIERKETTLAAKARLFEDEIDKYHRRTPYGYILGVRLNAVADKSEWSQHDSDNDGLWTAMYGAGECFAYAATKDPKAKKRATDAFEALRFLSQVTQGGSHPAPPGFPARTIVPTSGENPNEKHYTAEHDRKRQEDDPQWKVLIPRWPTSADGKWYWKTDTSSDELDGHYFLNALYYDLVAETEAEKQRARDVVVATTDHLLANDYALIDHDGKPTRWARFSPKDLNGGEMLFQRGLNSLSILSYLKVAAHMTGDEKYQKAYEELAYKHGYIGNVLAPKAQNGPGSGNQSDDEMAFMAYYTLLSYETDPRLKRVYMYTLYRYWMLEEPEMCPLFNYIFGAMFEESGFKWMQPPSTFLADALDTLERFPLDRVRWAYKNSHRTDIIPLPGHVIQYQGKGYRTNGKVVPIDERSIEFWNHNPWVLDEGHDGKQLSDGAAFLLPYYMGLYHGFIIE